MGIIKSFKADKLNVKIYKTRNDMGKAAALVTAEKIIELLKQKQEINMIFAAAPSQNEFLQELISIQDISWEKINAFHMDEYVGLPSDAPQGFGNFLKDKIFDRVPFKSVNIINGAASDIAAECTRYENLLKANPVDIVCLGIGENGHIAFNDPHVADFNDKRLVKKVELDEMCRMQQVNDGCFAKLSDVPTHALTLTIPALTNGEYMYCIVPGKTKNQAVFNTVRGEIEEKCPASILRLHNNAYLYTDFDSASRIVFRKSVITDEISQDFKDAVSVAVSYGMEAVEIRSVWEKGPHELNDADIKKIKEICKDNGLKVSAISSPVFKCDMYNNDEIAENYEILKKCVKLAKELDAGFVRGFTFWRTENYADNLDAIIELFKPAIDILKEENIIMAIETEPSVNACNAGELVKLLEKIDSPYIKALWDPGNDIFELGGETPYPDGYKAIKPYMVHMHLKDAQVNAAGNPESVAIGCGEVLYLDHFEELLKDGYDGYIALETHYRKKHEIKESLLRLPKGSLFSYMAKEATEECLVNWENMIQQTINRF